MVTSALSVRVRDGDTADALCGLAARVVVAHPERVFTTRTFQACMRALAARCEDITLTGAFDLQPYEALPIEVRGAVTRLSVLDSDENGSLRGHARLVVFGNLKQLQKLVLKCQCEVHLLGDLAAHTELCITAAALRVNDAPVPGTGGDKELFQWYRVPNMLACSTVRAGKPTVAPRVFTF